MKTIIINNVNFEVIRPRSNDKYMYTRNNILSCAGKGLYYYYAKPSQAKQSIYDMWHNWYIESCSQFDISIKHFGITGANCNCFTIGFTIILDENRYIGIITKAHNRLIQLN